jgi:hypothetical protein
MEVLCNVKYMGGLMLSVGHLLAYDVILPRRVLSNSDGWNVMLGNAGAK